MTLFRIASFVPMLTVPIDKIPKEWNPVPSGYSRSIALNPKQSLQYHLEHCPICSRMTRRQKAEVLFNEVPKSYYPCGASFPVPCPLDTIVDEKGMIVAFPPLVEYARTEKAKGAKALMVDDDPDSEVGWFER